MSEGSADLVRRIYDRLNRGDVGGVVELCHDDFVLDMSERVFNPDAYQGHEGVRRFHAGVRGAWKIYRWEVEEARVADDFVVAMLHCVGQAHEDAPDVDWRVAWLWKVQRGKAISARFYREREDALKAAGLR